MQRTSTARSTPLRDWRLEQGLTVEDIAGITGFTQPYLSRLERGLRGGSPLTKARIARALGVAYSTLFDPEEP